MQKNIIVLLVILLNGRLLNAQETNYRDTLRVYSIRPLSDIRSGQAEGARLTVHFNLIYNEARHNSKKPVMLEFQALFLTADGSPVRASQGTVYHISREGYAVTGINDMQWSNKKDLFIPYYALELPPGRHSLNVSLSCSVKDTAVTQESRPVPVTGMTQVTIQINKPRTRMFRMYVRELRVNPLNAKGRPWDSGFFSSTDPDLQYRIELRSKEHTDNTHMSSTVQDALSAGWIDFADPVTVSLNDRITLSVYDKDIFFHDPIGEISYSPDDWLRTGSSGQPISFGQVTSCIVVIEEIIRE